MNCFVQDEVIIMKVLQVVRVPAMGNLLPVFLYFKSQVGLIQTLNLRNNDVFVDGIDLQMCI